MSASAVITLKRMQVSHLQEILDVEKVSFTTAWSENSFRNEIENPYSLCLVAIRESAVIGYICVNCRFGEGHILNLAVHPMVRRMGLARHMIRTALDYMKENNCLFVYLEVRLSNFPARKLYQSLGFQEVGRRKLYYYNPIEDAVIMMLKL